MDQKSLDPVNSYPGTIFSLNWTTGETSQTTTFFHHFNFYPEITFIMGCQKVTKDQGWNKKYNFEFVDNFECFYHFWQFWQFSIFLQSLQFLTILTIFTFFAILIVFEKALVSYCLQFLTTLTNFDFFGMLLLRLNRIVTISLTIQRT